MVSSAVNEKEPAVRTRRLVGVLVAAAVCFVLAAHVRMLVLATESQSACVASRYADSRGALASTSSESEKMRAAKYAC